MIVMQLPQFPAQNDRGEGDGVPPISQWLEASTVSRDTTFTILTNAKIDPEIGGVLSRLRFIFSDTRNPGLSTTDLHDLTCFVLHRLIRPLQPSHGDGTRDRAVAECMRHSIILYMLIVHGPAYFSHAELQYTTATQLRVNLEHLSSFGPQNEDSLILWLTSIGMVASDGTPNCIWFADYARRAGEKLGVSSWKEVLFHLRNIIWLEKQQAEIAFQRKWDKIWAADV